MESLGNHRNGPSSKKRGQLPTAPASLLACLDQFLLVATKCDDRRYFPHSRDRSGINEDEESGAIESALFLLQNLPPSRSAVLAYLAQALSKQVWKYMQSKDIQTRDRKDTLVNQVETLLEDLVENSSPIWCPLVSKWAVNQLGRWSVEWEGVILSRDTTLEERVAGWLECGPARALANLTVSCIAHDADNTVAALLEASVHNGPVLNWLIAHVGCSFPATIINRILSLGLRNFVAASQNKLGDQLSSVSSVDTILHHLASRYFAEIECELQSVLSSALSENPDNCAKAAIPFLLQLATANQSRAILRAITLSLPQFLQSSENMPSLADQLSWWIPQYFPNTDSLIDIVVHLLLDVKGPVACEIMYVLLNSSVSSGSLQGNFSGQLLHYLLGELGSIVYMRRNHNTSKQHIALLTSLGTDRTGDSKKISSGSGMNILELIEWSLHLYNEIVVRKIGQLLTYIILDQGPEPSSFILRGFFICNTNVNQNCLFLLNCIMGAIIKHQSLLNQPSKTLTSAISGSFQTTNRLAEIGFALQKIEFMLIGSRIHKSALYEALVMALFGNLLYLSKLVSVPNLSLSTLEIITQLPLDKPISLSHLFCLGHAVVFLFFSSLLGNSAEHKIKISNLCNKILAQLSHSSLGHSFLLRLIFEGSFQPEWAALFGAKQDGVVQPGCQQPQLMKINLEFDSWVKLPKSHNTIFHAGKIGKEQIVARRIVKHALTDEEINLNRQLLLNLLGMSCYNQGPSQGATTIALLLVEYVSPDIIFNGFPWPEENIKFTFERDLTIKKVFEEFPIAWHYLELAARCRPALCYCSVLVRALTAAFTAFWNTCSWSLASQVPDQLNATKWLLEIMVNGQFLPQPFAVLPQMVGHLAPHEVVLILQDVWEYLRDHTPSPDRWVLLANGYHHHPQDQLEARYTDRCRKLIHMYIDRFGHLLPLVLKN